MSEKGINKAYSYHDIKKRRFDLLPFTGEWLRHQGRPERAGSILIYGESGHGKTTYAMQFMKYLCTMEKVFYNTVEEGMRASFRRSLELNGLQALSGKYRFQSEPYGAMIKRLQRKRQAKIVFVDSVQYCFKNRKPSDYEKLVKLCPNTLFVFISQMHRNAPKGAVAEAIKWDCQSLVRVSDFRATIEKSRCGGDEITPYIISKEKAEERELKLLKNG